MKQYYQVDYSKLLKELQRQNNSHIAQEKQVLLPSKADEEGSVASAKRMRKKALQNPEIRYIYSKGKKYVSETKYDSGAVE